MTLIPRVVDISHYEVISSFQPAKDAGIWGIIAKSTQGVSFRDPAYKKFTQMARDVGLLVGAYHFNDGTPVKDQVKYFIDDVNPQTDTLMALDYEAWPKNPMSVHQMVDFLHYFEELMKRKAVLYSGNLIKENIGSLNPTDQAYVASHRLWLAQYGPKIVLPKGFTKAWLHQYTGDGVGPEPHWVSGIACPGNKGLDLNTYDGTQDQLKAEWAAIKVTSQPQKTIVEPPKPVQPAPTPPPQEPPSPPEESWSTYFENLLKKL